MRYCKHEASGKTVSPDRSILTEQKLMKNAKVRKFKWDILVIFNHCDQVQVSGINNNWRRSGSFWSLRMHDKNWNKSCNNFNFYFKPFNSWFFTFLWGNQLPRCNLSDFENFEKVENLKVNRTGHISKSTLKLWNSTSEQSNKTCIFLDNPC